MNLDDVIIPATEPPRKLLPPAPEANPYGWSRLSKHEICLYDPKTGTTIRRTMDADGHLGSIEP